MQAQSKETAGRPRATPPQTSEEGPSESFTFGQTAKGKEQQAGTAIQDIEMTEATGPVSPKEDFVRLARRTARRTAQLQEGSERSPSPALSQIQKETPTRSTALTMDSSCDRQNEKPGPAYSHRCNPIGGAIYNVRDARC